MGTKLSPQELKLIEAEAIKQAKEYSRQLADEITFFQPVDFGVEIADVIVKGIDSEGKITIECGVNLNHEDAKRDAFYPDGRWNYGDLIYLLNNGWKFESDNPPRGMWHGQMTTALTQREGLHFIQSAVNSFNAGAPNGVKAIVPPEYER